MKERIYVCHTFYHVYITFLKELNLPEERRGKATLLLSKMSNDFMDMRKRALESGLFEEVYDYDEKRADNFEELSQYLKDKKNLIGNMIQRIHYTKKLAKLNAPFVPVDFNNYQDVYVFCDIDPIGYYLNYKKIRYHAVEDGLNCIANFDAARYDNRGNFRVKAFFSKKLNLIFIQNGYGKYCIDMEVNDISAIKLPCPAYVEQKREVLIKGLNNRDKGIIIRAFVRDYDQLLNQVREQGSKKRVLILTEPLCDLKTREKIFRDIIAMYEPQYQVWIKPHPRDVLNYREIFADYPQFDGTIPMEIFNYLSEIRFDKVVGVLTEMSGIHFADECIKLGPDFMDFYEEPSIHRQNEQIQ